MPTVGNRLDAGVITLGRITAIFWRILLSLFAALVVAMLITQAFMSDNIWLFGAGALGLMVVGSGLTAAVALGLRRLRCWIAERLSRRWEQRYAEGVVRLP